LRPARRGPAGAARVVFCGLLSTVFVRFVPELRPLIASGVMDAKLAGYLHRTRMPFNLTVVAQAAGLAALEDSEHVQRTRDNNRQGLRYYAEALPKLGATLTHSHANFVFADFQRPAVELYELLLRKGVIVRPFAGQGFPTCLRISVGTPAENERCVRALQEILT